jgi:penicillin-binding protein 1A
LLAVRLVPNFEYIIYRAKLAWCETERLEIQTDTLSAMLIFLEDKDFYKHKGISYKSMFRALLGIFRVKRPSGGSTITQQLVRTLFIVDFNKKFRRKFLELLLALWFEIVCSKQEILKMYLSSVQYERGVLGLPDAMKFFFDKILQTPTRAQAFFLIERVSNIRSLILFDKVCASIRQAHELKLLSTKDIHELVSIYIEMLNKGVLKQGKENIFEQLEFLRNKYKLHEAT